MNEVTISDLTSRADPDSIRISGTTDNHPAKINDLTIDLVPNTELAFDDVSDSDSDTDDEDEQPDSLKAATQALDTVKATIHEVEERLSSARAELSFVERFASTVASGEKSYAVPDPKTMKDTVALYNSQRATHFDAITGYTVRLAALEKEREIKQKAFNKETRAFARAIKSKDEERKKKKAEKEEKRREKREKAAEKLEDVYRVRITIELPSSDLTAQEPIANTAEVFQEAKLDLTYTTTSASWTPHYDLRLDTLDPSLSTLTYRAHFTNRTYETWSQAAITLSTSQASFGGLNEKIPKMEGWRVALAKQWNTTGLERGENGLYSLAEVKAKREAEKKEYGCDIAEERMRAREIEPVRLYKSKSKPGGSSFSGSMPRSSSFALVGSQAAPAYGGGAQKKYGSSSVEKDMDSGILEDGDETTLEGAGKTIQHSLAGSDTYG